MLHEHLVQAEQELLSARDILIEYLDREKPSLPLDIFASKLEFLQQIVQAQLTIEKLFDPCLFHFPNELEENEQEEKKEE